MGLPALRRIGGQDAPLHATTADNARLVHQVIEDLWNGGDLDLADHLFAPNYVNHGGLITDVVHGPEAIKVSIVLYRTAFPQFQIAIVDLLAQGPMVALRWIAHGTPRRDRASTHEAEEQPSDSVRGMTFARMNAGQIHESWMCWEPRGRQGLVSEQSLRV
jgi:predicted SnoaL-like aldol condensation-catalyzing enzyme